MEVICDTRASVVNPELYDLSPTWNKQLTVRTVIRCDRRRGSSSSLSSWASHDRVNEFENPHSSVGCWIWRQIDTKAYPLLGTLGNSETKSLNPPLSRIQDLGSRVGRVGGEGSVQQGGLREQPQPRRPIFWTESWLLSLICRNSNNSSIIKYSRGCCCLEVYCL